MENYTDYYEFLEHNPRDPSHWHAVFLDQSIPFDSQAKAAFLYDSQSFSRQFILPIARPIARLSIAFIQVLKIFMPRFLSSSKLLHRILYIAMKYFITPNANFLILRHFNLGSEIIKFIADNVPEIEVPLNPLKPKNLEAVKEDLFLEHDLNLFNFIIRVNKELRQKKLKISPLPLSALDFSAITTTPFEFEPFRKGVTNILDLNTAIELFTPCYQFFLTDNDFWRAANSLQLDEIIGVYAATLLNSHQHLFALNNKHPMIPLSTLEAGFRLMLHGLSTEILHALLVEKKLEQAKNS